MVYKIVVVYQTNVWSFFGQQILTQLENVLKKTHRQPL